MIGKTLGHYRIVEKLGQGGMGVVYRAHDTSLNRDVAIKALPESFTADPERKARFAREAKILAALNAPNIAAIYSLEEVEAKSYLVLELVEGKTLADRIAVGATGRSPIPIDEVLNICRQIAEGLEAAHEKGIVHRDLKPANIKITPEGNDLHSCAESRRQGCTEPSKHAVRPEIDSGGNLIGPLTKLWTRRSLFTLSGIGVRSSECLMLTVLRCIQSMVETI